MSKHRRAVTPKEDAQSFGFIGLLVGFILAYLGGEAVLAAYPIPTIGLRPARAQW